MPRARRSKLTDWLLETLRAQPDGWTVAAVTALGRQRYSRDLTSIEVANALLDLESMGDVTHGPWLKADGEPATRSNQGGCVRYWYAKEHAPS